MKNKSIRESILVFSQCPGSLHGDNVKVLFQNQNSKVGQWKRAGRFSSDN